MTSEFRRTTTTYLGTTGQEIQNLPGLAPNTLATVPDYVRPRKCTNMSIFSNCAGMSRRKSTRALQFLSPNDIRRQAAKLSTTSNSTRNSCPPRRRTAPGTAVLHDVELHPEQLSFSTSNSTRNSCPPPTTRQTGKETRPSRLW